MKKKGIIRCLIILLILSSSACSVPKTPVQSSSKSQHPITLERIAVYKPGAEFGESGVEISAYAPASKRLFLKNSNTGTITIIDLREPAQPVKIKSIQPSADHQNAGEAGNDASGNDPENAAQEEMCFIPAKNSPNRSPLLLVSNPIGSTVEIYEMYRSLALDVGELSGDKECGFLKSCD